MTTSYPYPEFRRRLPVQTHESETLRRTRVPERRTSSGLLRYVGLPSRQAPPMTKQVSSVSKEVLKIFITREAPDARCHLSGMNPESRSFPGKGLILGGSHSPNHNSQHSLVGDLSAVPLIKYQPTGKPHPCSPKGNSADETMENGRPLPTANSSQCDQFSSSLLDAWYSSNILWKTKATLRRRYGPTWKILPRQRCLPPYHRDQYRQVIQSQHAPCRNL